ncbi:aspartyl-phosphate phosphatase Spo0E family protein [Paenibacillus aestuarii]|uniref:Aspartyl-phosphate phosphatase Spo0E family protein n=1 Tax=Paenibacillus aestuarii TaxID=516965 RepID=A0ABW0K321_9BACL|nr:aspartyl-phosphate phosphatase Spo0E family protein [Paenibacillus aestuarii]
MLHTFVTEPQERLILEIERLREQMVTLGNTYGLLHPEVQHCSRQLDELLLQYYEIRRSR